MKRTWGILLSFVFLNVACSQDEELAPSPGNKASLFFTTESVDQSGVRLPSCPNQQVDQVDFTDLSLQSSGSSSSLNTVLSAGAENCFRVGHISDLFGTMNPMEVIRVESLPLSQLQDEHAAAMGYSLGELLEAAGELVDEWQEETGLNSEESRFVTLTYLSVI